MAKKLALSVCTYLSVWMCNEGIATLMAMFNAICRLEWLPQRHKRQLHNIPIEIGACCAARQVLGEDFDTRAGVPLSPLE